MAGIINQETLLIILGEAGLSLYPLLIKLVDTNLITQLKQTGNKITDKVTKIKLIETISNIKKVTLIE
jgi:hypothetical protein